MKASIVVSTLSLLGSAAAWGVWSQRYDNGCKGPCQIDTREGGIHLSCEGCTVDADDKKAVGFINECFTNKGGEIAPRDVGGGGGWHQSCKFKDVDGQGVIHADCKNKAQEWGSASVKMSAAPVVLETGGFWCHCFDCENKIV